MSQQRSPYSFAHLIQNWTQWGGDDANHNGNSGGSASVVIAWSWKGEGLSVFPQILIGSTRDLDRKISITRLQEILLETKKYTF